MSIDRTTGVVFGDAAASPPNGAPSSDSDNVANESWADPPSSSSVSTSRENGTKPGTWPGSMPDNGTRPIYMSFGLALLLLMVFGATALFYMQSLYGSVSQLVEVNLKKTDLTYAMRDAIRQRMISMTAMVSMDDPFERDAELVRFYALAGYFRVASQQLRMMPMGVDERHLFEDLMVSTMVTQPLGRRVTELLAVDAPMNDVRRALNVVIPERQNMLSLVEGLVRRHQRDAEATGQQAKLHYQQTMVIFALLGLASIVFVALMAAIAIRRVRERNESLQTQNSFLAQATREKSEFLASMSHEFRTPLTSIIGYSEMLEDDVNKTTASDLPGDLKKIRSAGQHLLSLINEVLDLSKIEAGHKKLEHEVFTVAEVVESVSSTIKPLINKNNNRLEVDLDNDAGVMRGDALKVRQILYNLLANACKFTRNGHIVLEVSRSQSGGQDWLLFRVEDNGIGIANDQLKTLFSPYTQASSQRNYGGTGLGLSISKRFCELMGGNISVVSEFNLGRSFLVQIPAELPMDDELENTNSRSKEDAPLSLVVNNDSTEVESQQKRAADDARRHHF